MCEASGRADDGGEGARRRVADRRQRCRRRHPVVHVPHLGIDVRATTGKGTSNLTSLSPLPSSSSRFSSKVFWTATYDR